MSTFSTISKSSRSWLQIPSDSDFSIQNLPFGIFATQASLSPRVGLALGEWVIDTVVLFDAGLLSGVRGLNREHLNCSSLNSLMAAGSEVWRALRLRVAELFTEGNDALLKKADIHARA
ncbi:fumarylacetoacetase, partial [bacterium]|nr:fumarylacetoacetase [bacterium]